MPTNSAFDEYFKASAARLAQNKNITASKNVWANYKPVTGAQAKGKTEDESLGGNLGQGIIDFLSTGTYAVAGIGNRIGESVGKLAQGDLSNVVQDIIPGYNVLAAAGEGIAEKRTWSENLKDLGADEGTSTWAGLALDIVLDPAWLIPGGAIGKGITGTARGIGEASRLTKEGVKLTPEVMKGVQAATEDALRPGLRNLPKVKTKAAEGETAKYGYGILSDVLKPSGEKISVASPQGLQNFYQGIKQANIENYSEWSAARAAKKQNYYMFGSFSRKRPEYRAELKNSRVVEDIPADSELFQAEAPIGNVADQAVDAVEKIVDSKIKTQKVADEFKDAGAAEDIATATVEKVKAAPAKTPKTKAVKAAEVVETAVKTAPTGSVYSRAKQELAPARTEYQKANGFDTTDINYAAIKVSEEAPEMARVYDQLVSDPTNPAVISAYKKLVEETKKQYDYLTNKLGIKIEYIKGDPYNVKNAKGEMVPDSRLMMEDVLKNKRLQVRDSEIDFAEYPHPILTIEENNLFRAVHDFFGHAASGRGFAADGEEAAWVSHSSMFTPEARRAMTTETRGQNSYYNFFDPERKSFAPQKAALFPEEYSLLPAELDLVTGQALTANSFFGRTTNVLSEFSDNVLDELGRVQTPIRGTVLYTPQEIAKIEAMVAETVQVSTYKAGQNIEVDEVLQTIRKVVNLLNDPFPEKLVTLAKPTDVKTLKLLQQTLDTPVDVTPLLNNLVKAEGRTTTAPPAFKSTYWGTKKGKPAFKTETLAKYFVNDELLADPKKLGIAMGTTSIKEAKIYTRKGETPAQAYARYQDTIWEDFRARNVEKLETIKATEKAEWNAKYNQADSELFTETSAGELVGLGNLPAGLPANVLTGSFNGKSMSTLGKMLENIDSMLVQGTLNPATKNLLIAEFTKVFNNVKTKGIKAVDMTDAEMNAAATKLLSKGVVKSFADAKIAISGKTEDLRKLATRPQMKLYVKDRASLRKTSTLGKGQKVRLLERNSAGLPIDKAGNVITEREAMKLQVSNLSGAADNFVGLYGSPIPQMRMVTETGTEFTGRSGKAGSEYAAQTGLGKQQLASLQAVREAIGEINTGIKAKEFIAIPEQAALLTNVMTSLGIKVADNIAPEAAFKQFQKEALPAFNEMIAKIESAAKSEAIIYQARGVFNRSIEENLTLMKAIEATDPGELQRSVVKFTEDSMALVDDYCAINYASIGGPKLSATEFLQQVAPGISKGIIYG